ncbi:MAG TPA: hypothetical protein VFR37_05130 [Longimicrobium sp.]|nr:hypothetical protein [Longimicrobium sp.]
MAYSTGLLLGRVLVEIVADLIGAHPRKGNRMSTAKADVLELLEEGREVGEMERLLGRITLAKDYPHPGRELNESETDLWNALQEITAPTAKAEILAALDQLPDDCTMDDILEELDEREHLRRGVASAIYEPLVSQEEMEAWFEQWARE